ncbi:hypothetical protein Dimus_036133, partial [Dionaea muscipula]
KGSHRRMFMVSRVLGEGVIDGEPLEGVLGEDGSKVGETWLINVCWVWVGIACSFLFSHTRRSRVVLASRSFSIFIASRDE